MAPSSSESWTLAGWRTEWISGRCVSPLHFLSAPSAGAQVASLRCKFVLVSYDIDQENRDAIGACAGAEHIQKPWRDHGTPEVARWGALSKGLTFIALIMGRTTSTLLAEARVRILRSVSAIDPPHSCSPSRNCHFVGAKE
jgi:hypothetical protein